MRNYKAFWVYVHGHGHVQVLLHRKRLKIVASDHASHKINVISLCSRLYVSNLSLTEADVLFETLLWRQTHHARSSRVTSARDISATHHREKYVIRESPPFFLDTQCFSSRSTRNLVKMKYSRWKAIDVAQSAKVCFSICFEDSCVKFRRQITHTQ